jgi:type VI secretion system protein ImpL
MKKLLGLLIHPWTLAILGLLALALIIFLIGPLVAIGRWRPLETTFAQLVLIGAIVALYLAVKLVSWLRARRTNRGVVAALSAAAPAGEEGTELRQLRTRFDEALAALRDARLQQQRGVWSSLSWRYGRRYLYELPWYVIIGSPGSGKTTALLNSGLRFPLAERFGAGAIKGVGGTRNCDWWFAEQAVLIDTAGRYTTHESDPQGDRRAWDGFLDLLKRTRPRRPLNGVLVTVSISDLLVFSAQQRAEYAATLRKRVDELQQKLGLRLPVYLFATKCDLLGGFMDYFADGDKLERGQPWGFTFAEGTAKADAKAQGLLERFATEFDRLTQRLLDGVIDRVQTERDRERRARIYGFPQQFGGLRTALAEVLGALTASSAFAPTPLVRGVYFVSGTQEGTPFDRMVGALARDLHLDRGLLPPNRSTGRSFFLSQVLSDVVFAEAGLVGTNLAWERRRTALIWGTYALTAAGSALLLLGWAMSYLGNRAAVEAFERRVEALEAQVQKAPSASNADLRAVLPALGAAAELARPEEGSARTLGLGLNQGAKLHAAAEQTYHRMLRDGLLPRITTRIEQLLRESGGRSELQYESLKAYVMLHSPEHFDREALRDFIRWDWSVNLASQLTADQRAELTGHLLALFELTGVAAAGAEDAALERAVRTQLAATPLSQRIYGRLKLIGVEGSTPPFSVAGVAGQYAGQVFVLSEDSAAPATSVDGLYTVEGYRQFDKSVDKVTAQLAEEEGWVLDAAARKPGGTERGARGQVAEAVREIYLNDYIQRWDALIANIRLARPGNLQMATEQARILASPENPLVLLLRAMVRETTLLAPPEATDVVGQAEARARDALQKGQEKFSKLFGNSGAAPAAVSERPEKKVDDHFGRLHEMLKTLPGSAAPGQLDPLVSQSLAEAFDFLSKALINEQARNPPPPPENVQKLAAQSQLLPEPLHAVLGSLAKNAVAATLSGERGNLTSALAEKVGRFCRRAIENRFPLSLSARDEVAKDDFAAFFGPGGMVDDFFVKYDLRQYVDTSTHPWTYKRIGDSSLGSGVATLRQFEGAAAIRDAFFRNGAREPTLQLQFSPYDMDAAIAQFTLDVDGQKVEWAHGPKIPKSVIWPAPNGTGQVRLTMNLSDHSAPSVVTEGPWALFHLFERMSVEPSATPDRFTVKFRSNGGPEAIFNVSVGSVNNPFTLAELHAFQCPGSL